MGLSLPLIAFEGVMAALAIVLARHRDVGAGLLPQRRGATEPPALLADSLGLAWRLQRAAFLGWLAAFRVLSLIVGQIVTRSVTCWARRSRDSSLPPWAVSVS